MTEDEGNSSVFSRVSVNQLIRGTGPLRGMHTFRVGAACAYHWERENVLQLLDDIEAFRTSDRAAEETYDFHALVVAAQDDAWQVLDGQQRLTTLFLLLNYLGAAPLALKFETPPPANRLENPEQVEDGGEAMHSAGILCAWQLIDEWFHGKSEADRDAFLRCLLERVEFLWHELRRRASQQAFIAFNSGRFQLMAVEFMKGIFVEPSRTTAANGPDRETVEKIMPEWKTAEQALREEAFWRFLNPPKNADDKEARIAYIFEIAYGIPAGPLPSGLVVHKHLQALDKEKKFSPATDWETVWNCFLTLQEWFHDRSLRQAIRFLQASGLPEHAMENFWEIHNAFGRTAFRKFLADAIRLERQRLPPPPHCYRLFR